MPAANAVRTGLSHKDWRILALLIVSVAINYADRSNLSVGATDIQRELHITNYQLGKLLSFFFWTYAACQLFGIAGWLVDRFNVCWVFAAGFFLWSGATAFTGFAGSFATLLGMRLLLGMGESVAYPAYSKILANHFPEHRRGLANALLDAGTKLGPSIGTLAGGLLIVRFGWRVFFVALGFGSLLWLVPWLIWMPRGGGASDRMDPKDTPSVLDIVKERSAWGTFFGLFCANYLWYFLITWLPPYLEKDRHFPKAKMAVIGSISFLVISLATIAAGWLADRWIARGGTPTRVRKTFSCLGLAFATILLPMALTQNETVAMVLLMAGCLSYGTFASTHWAITQTLAGPLAAGKWTGLQNGVANLAGIASPWVTGWVVQRTGHFYLAFVAVAAVSLAGSACYLFVVGPVEQVAFARSGRARGVQRVP